MPSFFMKPYLKVGSTETRVASLSYSSLLSIVERVISLILRPLLSNHAFFGPKHSSGFPQYCRTEKWPLNSVNGNLLYGLDFYVVLITNHRSCICRLDLPKTAIIKDVLRNNISIGKMHISRTIKAH